MLPETNHDFGRILVARVHGTGRESGRSGEFEGGDPVGSALSQEFEAGVEEEFVVAGGIGASARGHGGTIAGVIGSTEKSSTVWPGKICAFLRVRGVDGVSREVGQITELEGRDVSGRENHPRGSAGLEGLLPP